MIEILKDKTLEKVYQEDEKNTKLLSPIHILIEEKDTKTPSEVTDPSSKEIKFLDIAKKDFPLHFTRKQSYQNTFLIDRNRNRNQKDQ